MMSTRARVVLSLVVAFVAFVFSVSSSIAASSSLSGTVTDKNGDPVPGATISAVDPATGQSIATATTDASGSYGTSIQDGIYNLQVTPPTGSALSPLVALNESISGDTTLSFVLVAASPVDVNGHVADAAGNPMAGQNIEIYNSASFAPTTTDASGNFAFNVVPGSYTLALYGGSGADARLPQNYYVYTTSPLTVTQNTTLNLTFPALTEVTVHVQDPFGNPLAGVSVASSQPIVSSLTLGGLPSTGFSQGNGETDSSGNVTFPLFPSSSGAAYAFTTTPPSNSDLVPVTATNVSVAGSTSDVTIVEVAPTPASPSPTDTTTAAPTTTGTPAVGPLPPMPTTIAPVRPAPTSSPTGAPTPASAPSTPTVTRPPSTTPTPATTPETLTPTARLSPTATSTPTYTPTPTATATPTVTPTATAALPSPEPTATPTSGGHPTATPCASPDCKFEGRTNLPSTSAVSHQPSVPVRLPGPPPLPPTAPPSSLPSGGSNHQSGPPVVHPDADLSATGVAPESPRVVPSGSSGTRPERGRRDDPGRNRHRGG